MPRTFYRIVRSNPPSLIDFMSDEMKGLPPRNDDPETLRLWTGLSVYVTRNQARNKARTYPWLGGFIARLEIPEAGTARWERTTTSRGHYTLWGAPPDVLKCVVSVEPVIEVE